MQDYSMNRVSGSGAFEGLLTHDAEKQIVDLFIEYQSLLITGQFYSSKKQSEFNFYCDPNSYAPGYYDWLLDKYQVYIDTCTSNDVDEISNRKENSNSEEIFESPSQVCDEFDELPEFVIDSPNDQKQIDSQKTQQANEDEILLAAEFAQDLAEIEGYYTSNGKAYSMLSEVPLGQIATYQPIMCGGGRGRKRKTMKKERGRPKTRDKVYASQLGLRNPPAFTKFTPTVLDEWSYEFNMAADGSGNLSYYAALRNPTSAVNSSGTYPRANDFAKLYDEFKLLSLTLIIDFVTLNTQQGVLTIGVDYDSIGSGTYTPTDLRDNQYMRKLQAPNQIAYTVKEVPISEGTYRGAPSVIHQRGWYDFNSPPDEGVLVITGESFPSGSAVARCILRARVKMRRRRTLENARDQRLAEEEAEEKLSRKRKC